MTKAKTAEEIARKIFEDYYTKPSRGPDDLIRLVVTALTAYGNENFELAACVAEKYIEEENRYDVIGTSRYIAKDIRALKCEGR